MENYISYLNFVDEKINKFFESQKPFIFCKKGCGTCCKNSLFPYTLTEMNYLLAGMMLLPEETQDTIANNIQKVLEEKEQFKGEKFYYNCPFLINDVCSVYEYRGVICRAFGLMTLEKDESVRVPFCCFDGLNYSNVVDVETSVVSPEKCQSLDCEERPMAFNVSYSFLTNSDFEEKFNFKFGDRKPLIDWFINNEH